MRFMMLFPVMVDAFLERFDRLWLPKAEQAHNVDIAAAALVLLI
jgi:hypothetical protein